MTASTSNQVQQCQAVNFFISFLLLGWNISNIVLPLCCRIHPWHCVHIFSGDNTARADMKWLRELQTGLKVDDPLESQYQPFLIICASFTHLSKISQLTPS